MKMKNYLHYFFKYNINKKISIEIKLNIFDLDYLFE